MATRRFSRVRFNVNATIEASGRKFQGGVENLSMNGMFLVTRERLAIDAPVDITIMLDGSDPLISVSFCGKVSRVTDDGLGFSFEKIDLDSYTHLKNIIAYNIDDAERVNDEIHHSIDEKLSSGV